MNFFQRNIAANSIIIFVVTASAILITVFRDELLSKGKKARKWQKEDDELDEALAQSMDASDSTARY